MQHGFKGVSDQALDNAAAELVRLADNWCAEWDWLVDEFSLSIVQSDLVARVTFVDQTEQACWHQTFKAKIKHEQ